MPRVTHWLLAVVIWIGMEEFRLRAEELSVAVDGSREGLGEPVQRCAVEHVVHRWSLVGPLLELLADPVQVVNVRLLNLSLIDILPCKQGNWAR